MSSMHTKNKKTLINIFTTTLTVFIIFIGWIILSDVKNNQLIFPSVKQIFLKFENIFTSTGLKAFGFSLYRLLISIAFSFLVSFLVMLLYIVKKWTFGFFSPIVKIMRSVPFVSFSIFVLLIFGNKSSPYIIATLVIMPIVIDGLKSGIDSIDKNLTDDLALLDIGIWKKIFQVYLPILLPNIITLVLQTFGLGFKVMVMGEYLSQTPISIGKELYNAKSYLEMDLLIAWTIVIVVITSIVEFFVNLFNNKYRNTVY